MTNENKLASMDAVGELPDFGNLLLREDNYPHLPSGKTKYKMISVPLNHGCGGCVAECERKLCDSLPDCMSYGEDFQVVKSYIFEVQL